MVGAAALAAGTAWLTRSGRGFVIAAGAVGAVSGLVAGVHRIYDWRTARGRAAFVLDHTWALATTATGVLGVAVNRAMGEIAPDVELSERRNRLVHRRGFVLRRGFAVTFGYVVNGAAGTNGDLTPSRRNLVDRHEDVHVWQARVFGPVYAAVYSLWAITGTVTGFVSWLANRERATLAQFVDAHAYYRNPFEWHAYSRDGNWPPRSANPELVWDRPFPSIIRGSSGIRATPH